MTSPAVIVLLLPVVKDVVLLQVANGASELLGEVFGERGKHARSAVGTNALPLNVPVEIEAILEVE